MHRRDLIDLVLLAALWGASFLFTRIAVPAFGPLALAEVRVAIAAVMLVPLLAWRADLSELRTHARAVPAARRGEHGDPVLAVRLRGAVDHRRSRVDPQRHRAAVHRARRVAVAARTADARCSGWAWRSAWPAWPDCRRARRSSPSTAARWRSAPASWRSLSYGVSANVVKRYFTGVRPLAVAAGSQSAAAVLLLPFAIAFWPSGALGRRRLGSAGSRSACCAPDSPTSSTSA